MGFVDQLNALQPTYQKFWKLLALSESTYFSKCTLVFHNKTYSDKYYASKLAQSINNFVLITILQCIFEVIYTSFHYWSD